MNDHIRPEPRHGFRHVFQMPNAGNTLFQQGIEHTKTFFLRIVLQQRIPIKLRAKAMKPERQPASFEPAVPGQKYPFSLPE